MLHAVGIVNGVFSEIVVDVPVIIDEYNSCDYATYNCPHY